MKLTGKQKAAYGIGAIGKDVVYMLISGYLLYYYNAVLGVSSTFIGTMMMFSRIFDAFNDPLMGIVVAKTNTKWGKFRPWIMAGTVLNAFVIYALFATPGNLADSGKKIWLTVFYLLWGITYTLMDIPFWSMIPAITESGPEREQVSALARSCSGIGSALPTILTMIVVPALSGSAVIKDYYIGFKYWGLIIAVAFILSELVCVLLVPEHSSPEDEKKTKIRDMFTSLVRNDQAMTVVVSIVLVYTALNLVGNLILYFFQFDVGNTGAYSVFVAVSFAAQVAAMMTFPLIRKKYGKMKLFVLGFLIQITGFAILLIMSCYDLYKSLSWTILCIPGVLVYAGFGLLNVLLTIFLSDSVDYGEWKNGTREESVIFSMQTFTVKLSAGLAVFVAGLALDLINLNVEKAVQTKAALMGLRFMMTIPSILLLVVGIFVFLRFYRLDEKKMQELSEQMEKSGRDEA